MNNILQLKGKFHPRKYNGGGGPTNLPKGAEVTVQHLESLKVQLQRIIQFWETDQYLISGALVSVHYKSVVAKSNRLKTILSEGSKSPIESIRGAKFVKDENSNQEFGKHVFTHFVSVKAIIDSVEKIENSIRHINDFYNGKITDVITSKINSGVYNDKYIKKYTFLKLVVDAFYVEKFAVDVEINEIKEDSIVSIYRTGVEASTLLSGIGIDMINAKMIDETTLRLTPIEMKLLIEKAPYLISMNVRDFSEFLLEDIVVIKEPINNDLLSIPSPNREPVIGVIDTQFDENVYFNEWVEYHRRTSDDIPLKSDDFCHGTAVTSIIVDGPAFNPSLDDGCGRFRVRHFGVATAGRFSSFTILKLIRNIISENTDIKVWNLSLGSSMEIHSNFISPEAAELDKIQSEYDVIFIVAGTNKSSKMKQSYKIGAPADSLNSLVVNSVDNLGRPASYTRVGPVLSFFHKPDVSYYGGDGPTKIVVCEPLGRAYVTGTSYAAPWITRKMAYLIHNMGLSREVAKALIVDSAAGWNRKDDKTFRIGYGVVPIRIEDILNSEDDEIRFIMTGTIDEYETYTFNIPVPQDMNTHPFFAKATLVYFPKCNRSQGVDYTSTEMDIHFGRVKEKDGKAIIQSIDCNSQADNCSITLYEPEARMLYRKWDNIKHISETIKEKSRPRKVYESGMWGLSIKTKERSTPKAGRGLKFGVVVTLKEMNGVNRIDDFIKMCGYKGWLVNRLDVVNQIDIYNIAEEEIKLE